MKLQEDARVHQHYCLAYGEEQVARQPLTRCFLLVKDIENVEKKKHLSHIALLKRSVLRALIGYKCSFKVPLIRAKCYKNVYPITPHTGTQN